MFKKIDTTITCNNSGNTTEVRYTPSFGIENRIKHALLKLKIVNSHNYALISVLNGEKIVDQISPTSNQRYVYINITDELASMFKTNNKQYRLKFVCAANESIVFNQAESCVLIEYEPNCLINNGTIQTFDVKRAGTGKLNLFNGYFSFEHKDIDIKAGALKFSLNHIYNMPQNSRTLSGVKLFCGKNWKLNIQQFLKKEIIKEVDSINNESAKRFTYIDGDGNHHLFEEKFYYINENGYKCYLPLNQIDIDFNGNLSFENRTVKKEIITSTGLVLSSEVEGFKGLNKVDNEIEKISEIKNSIKSIDRTINDYEDIISQNYKDICILALSMKVASENYSERVSNSHYSEKYYNLQKDLKTAQDALQKLEKHKLVCNNSKRESFLNGIDVNEIINAPESHSKSFEGIVITEQEKEFLIKNHIYDKTQAAMWEDLKNSPLILSSSMMTYQKNSIDAEKRLLETKKPDDVRKILNIFIGEERISNVSIEKFMTYIGSYYSLSDTQYVQMDIQIDELVKKSIHYGELKQELEEQKQVLLHDLSTLEKRIPKQFLQYNNGIVMGFADSETTDVYRLIMISDKWDNTVYINYNDNDQIENIICNDKITTVLEYDKDTNNLISINNKYGQKIRYAYKNDLISKIIYPNETTSEYVYDELARLISVIDSSRYGIKNSFDGNMLSQISEYSNVESISKDGLKYNQNMTNVQKRLFSFSYNNYSTNSLDRFNNQLEYRFDASGNLLSVYKFKTKEAAVSRKNVKVKTFSYKNDKLTYNTSLIPYSEDFLNGSVFVKEIAGEEEKLYPLSVEQFDYFDNLLLSYDWRCGDELFLSEYSYEAMPDSENKADNEGMVYTLNEGNENGVRRLKRTLTKDMIDKINSVNKKDFILSCWAKADSACVIRRKTCYCEQCGQDETDEVFSSLDDEYIRQADDRQSNRRFELRAEIEYLNKDIVDTQYVSFNWMQQDWQYCALPISISDDLNDIVKSITVYFDYSYNTGDAQLLDMTMKEGDWEYAEYNEDGLKVYTENSESQRVSTYEYDDNNNLVKVMSMNKHNYALMLANQNYNCNVTKYEYNHDNALIRIVDYNGIVNEYIYNDSGIVIRTITYHCDEPANKFCDERLIDDNGNETGSCNEFGEQVSKFEYVSNSDKISTSEDIDGNKVAYGYDNSSDTLIEISSSINGEQNSNIINYKGGLPVSISHSGMQVDYIYDAFGYLNEILIAGESILSKTYEENDQFSSESTQFKTGEQYTLITENNNLTKIIYNRKLIVENDYDRYDRLVTVKDYENNAQQNIIYDGKKAVEHRYTGYGDTYAVKSAYNSSNLPIKKKVEFLNGIVRDTDYIYDEELNNTKLTKMQLANGIMQQPLYDKLGRISGIRCLKGKDEDKISFGKDIFYKQIGANTSNLVASEWFEKNGRIKDRLSYTYDCKGNIISVKENDIIIARYTYDALSRLVREDNKKLDKTTIYSYDKSGNIVNKRVFTYTVSESINLEGGTLYNYEYSSDGWKDPLLSYNGEICGNYDALGNPRKYRNFTLRWSHGRQLDKYGDNSYGYDVRGARISKTVNGVKTTFYVHDAKILAQECNNETQYFNYGIDGLNGFTYRGNEYYYKKNIHEDILAIIDEGGQEIVQYVYDAWGNHKTLVLSNEGNYIDSSLAHGNVNLLISNINPFRYRSYYYDLETGLYYINSRYYDPVIGRFINADNINAITFKKLNGLNMYSYCWNNPLMYVDKTGYSADSIWFELIKRYSQHIVYSVESEWQLTNQKLIGSLIGNVKASISISSDTPNGLYSYSTVGSESIKEGIGVNFNGIGASFYASSNGNVGVNVSLFNSQAGISLGADGIGLSFGISIDKVSASVEVNIGWGTVAVAAVAAVTTFAIVSAVPLPGMRVVGAIASGIVFIIGLFI